MKFAGTFALLAGVLAVAACGGGGPNDRVLGAGESADRVLTSGIVRTVDPDNPEAEAVAVRDGRIAVVGSDADAMAVVGEGTEVIDLDGRALVPGFHDVHLHAIEAGRNAGLCFLRSGLSAKDYVRLVERCARQQRGERWVRGSGPFVQDLLALTEDVRALLDRAEPRRPVVINDALGHAAFVNSAALRAAGIAKGSPDPRGGKVLRAENGEPTGVLLENAQNVALDAAEPRARSTRRANYRALRRAIDQLNANGITSVSDAGGYWPRQHHRAWERALNQGELGVRASNALFVYPNRSLRRQLRAATRIRDANRDPDLRFDQVKIYVDGIADYGSAALAKRYGRKPAWSPGGKRGFTYFSRRRLNRFVDAFDRRGFQVHLHVWGDRATRLGLDAIERAGRRNGEPDAPHRITHLYLVDERDRARFAELGVVADFQLGAGAIAPRYAQSLRAVIGATNARKLLPVQSLLASGANTVLSSDWDADELSPLGTMERALTRRASSEIVADAATALRMVTLDSARLLGQDEITGSIEVGKLADLVVLDGDPLDVEPAQIAEIDILLTLLDGEDVYRDDAFPAPR